MFAINIESTTATEVYNHHAVRFLALSRLQIACFILVPPYLTRLPRSITEMRQK